MRGVWRLWCEHGGDSQHVQGQPLRPFTTTTPPHVFELHPLLRVADLDLAGSFRPIDGFTYKEAGAAFRAYEQLSSHITTGEGTTTITTRMAGFNYVELVIRLNEEPIHVLPDGLTVKAAVLDTGGELLVGERRMVAVAGTLPYTRLKALHKGDALHVVGVPRIDLSLVAWRVANASRVPGVLDWSLPYEIVLVAAFDGRPSGPDLPPPAAAGDEANPAAGAIQPPAPVPAGVAAPVEPVTSAIAGTPAGGPEGADAAEADAIPTLLRLLGQSTPPDAPRGACTFASGQRSYCATISEAQCDQLGGAFNGAEVCPPADGSPAAPPPAARPPEGSPPPPADSSPQPADSAAPAGSAPPSGSAPPQTSSPQTPPPEQPAPEQPPREQPPREPQPPPPAAARPGGA